ncbi:MAG: GNAT family N-acetyltransferase [Bacteroidetes bacterium]|nr:GNAT family N-acetyltransferase [Bacteroidota bacterium]
MQHRSVFTISLREQPEIWDRLFADSPDATVFGSVRWLTLLATVFGREAFAVIAGDPERPTAGIPVLQHRRGPLRLSSPLPITLYAGILRSRGPALPLDDLLPTVERRLHFASLNAVWSQEERTALSSRGWELRRRHTYRLDIDNTEQIWNGYSQSLRRKLRRVPAGGFRLDVDPPTAMIVRLFDQSYSRHGIRPPLPGVVLDRWLAELRRNNLAFCFAACHPDGRPAAVRVVLRDGPRLFDWLAGSDPAVAPSASHWLVHTILDRFSGEGCELFDFMGANTPGVSDFKRGFGGSLFEYDEAEWYRPSLLRHLSALRNRRRRRWRGLP